VRLTAPPQWPTPDAGAGVLMSNRQLHDWQHSVVAESMLVAEGVRRIVLDLPGCPVAALGSHLDVLLPLASGEVVRSYSVIEDGRFPDHISLGVRLDPNSSGGSTHMHLLRPGDDLITSQPVQTFDLTWGLPRYTLLAGGIGITPLVGMARRLRALKADYQLIYVGRTREAMPFVDGLLADHAERVRVHVGAEQGRIDVDALIRGLSADTELYVCGPIEMLMAAKRSWAADGRRVDRLRFETFGSGATRSSVAFRVLVPRLGVDTVVPADKTLLDVLDSAGAEVISDCLRGECGLCLVNLLDHEQEIDHRNVFLSERQQADGDQLCACVSRSLGGTLTIDVP